MTDVRVILVIGWMVVIAVGGIVAALRAKRQLEMPDIASAAGLHFSMTDPFDCSRVKFTLFSRGDGGAAENVMWREADDGHVYRAFDYDYYDEHRGQNGQIERTHHHFSCAMALVGSSWPEIQIVREGVINKLLNAASGGELDIDVESEEFNRMFAVHCADRRFATALIDAQMIDFLLSTKGELNFELKGRWLLVWTTRIDPVLMPGLLAIGEKFVARIPRVVWELYPSSFVDASGRPLPPADDELTRLTHDLADAQRHDPDVPFEELARSPYEALERHDGVEFDLDGHRMPDVKEDPWGPGHPPRHS